MRILMIGDIYGAPGRALAIRLVPVLRARHGIDWVIANGENATGGTGLSPHHRDKLLAAGIDLLTGGNHLFARPDWPATVGGAGRALRPHNLGGDGLPGKGWAVLEQPERPPLAVINLEGRVFLEPADCPFRWADTLLTRLPAAVPVVVDFHAEATSEKIALAWHLDGRVAFVAGTHTHVQTSDERILPGGTGVITDLGMTGPRDGILGVHREIVLGRFRNGFSERFQAAEGPSVLEGVLFEISSDDGRTRSIRRLRLQDADDADGVGGDGGGAGSASNNCSRYDLRNSSA